MGKAADKAKQGLKPKKASVKKRDDQLQELDRIAKMLVRRDFALMETKEKREAELKELKKIKIALEKAKSSLEIKVAERTKELNILTYALERQVEERTTELKGKVRELQKMNDLMVGRELRMVELKAEAKRLRKELQALRGHRSGKV